MSTKKRKLKVLFLDIFTDDPKLRKKVQKKLYGGGTYADHVRKVFGLKTDEWQTIYADKNKFPTRPPQIDALIIGGSAKNPVRGENTAWMKESYKFIKRIVGRDIPVLGICGGLQFVVKAMGGEVIYNPKGREFGTVNIKIEEEDPLFRGLGKQLQVQENHVCMAGKLPIGANVLASSDLCQVQSIAIGGKVRLVQFHPERRQHQTRAILKEVKEERYNNTPKSQAEYQKLMKSIKNTTKTDSLILKNFLNYFVYSNV